MATHTADMQADKYLDRLPYAATRHIISNSITYTDIAFYKTHLRKKFN